MTEDQSNCTRIVACVGNQGVWFNGRGFGNGAGTFAGAMSDGSTCSGDWVARNAIGIGQASVTCTDGRKGTVYYTYQDPRTGTALGKGRMNTGEDIEIWTGRNVLAYLSAKTGQALILPCSGGAVPIS